MDDDHYGCGDYDDATYISDHDISKLLNIISKEIFFSVQINLRSTVSQVVLTSGNLDKTNKN